VEKGNVEICYCPTNMMIGDFFTKLLQGKKFEFFRDLILGKKSASSMELADRSVLGGKNSCQLTKDIQMCSRSKCEDENVGSTNRFSVLC
jgi:hypothetical protein